MTCPKLTLEDNSIMLNVKVAVIGLGPAGLTAIKALREEGFEVTGFERRDRVGGVWSYSDNLNYTSVVPSTVANVSKFVRLSKYPPYMTGEQVAEYFQLYATHFKLKQHVRFKTTVRRVLRDQLDQGWNIHITGPDGDEVLHFGKVVFATGSDTVPVWPSMARREEFKGPEQFAGKRVLVVGLGNTACEVSLDLTGHASKVYHSYRHGRMMVPRYFDNGLPTDCTVPWPGLRFKDLLDYKLRWLASPLADRSARRKMIRDAARQDEGLGLSERTRRKRAEEKIRRDWRLLPCASMAHVQPVVQDHFIPALYLGQITPVRGFKAFAGADRVLLDDGSAVEVDAVIFCTGYSLDFSILPELEMDGACGLPLLTSGDTQASIRSPREPHLPRLHHMIFPPRWASSVAFLSWMLVVGTAWSVSELASMAVAQVWAASTARERALSLPPKVHRRPALLPSEVEMNAEVDKYHAWWRREKRKESSLLTGFVRSHTFYRFLHEMAGTGMYDHLDHPLTLRGWWLKWKDKQLYTWLSKGPANSHAWRVFETNPKGIPGCGRRTWPRARQALEDAVGLPSLVAL
ncbi:hypothetical protein DL765_000170 [Monosporascus sp. GIB2]|nr:hypothetical protein DL765_000170 [Monosporascus sp. GIB2]